MSLANIGAQSRIFADQCVLKGFVPPHPGDLGRVLGEDVIEKALRKGKDASEQDLGVGEAVACTDDERAVIADFLRFAKNPMSQYLINKLHETMPRLPKKEIRNVVRSLISSGEIQGSCHA